MSSRFILINCPGLGVGDVRNSSPVDHSLEQLLKYAVEKELVFDLSGLESIGFDAFIRYQGSSARKSSVTARLASRNVHGNEDFEAFAELGGGDATHLPVYSGFTQSTDIDAEDDIFTISIGSDESIVPAYEHIATESDGDVRMHLLDVLSAPLVRNEFIVANFGDFREAALETNPTFAGACLAHLSKTVGEVLPLLGATDGLMVLSTTAIDCTVNQPTFRNELTPMMFHTPVGQTHDLGLRLLSDVGPSIAEFFGRDRTSLIGASMGKWMAPLEETLQNPQEQGQSPIHS